MHFVKKAVDAASSATHRNTHRYDYRRFCHNISFGHSEKNSWSGIDLNDFEQTASNRYFLQMRSWRYYLETAMHYGHAVENSYMEVKYEDFCHQPVEQIQNVFQFLGQSMTADTEQFLQQELKPAELANGTILILMSNHGRTLNMQCSMDRIYCKAWATWINLKSVFSQFFQDFFCLRNGMSFS